MTILRKCSDQLMENGIIESISLGEVDEISRFQFLRKLYGREQEFQGLLDAYERSRSGSMEFVLIGGHAGSGKIALVKTIQRSVMHRKGMISRGNLISLGSLDLSRRLLLLFVI